MAGRRIVPLIVLVLLGTVLLVLRLHQLQVLERGVWAGEAANLVRSGSIRPYTRGAIFDARGRVLRSDRSSYRIEFVYREFRRAHPLGLVAHARSTLLGSSVSLVEAYQRLAPWADELIELTPAQLARFAEGDALTTASLDVAAAADPEREERRSRRADLRFYVTTLLDLSREQRRALAKLAARAPESSWIELAARVSEGASEEQLRSALQRRLAASVLDLQVLAGALQQEQDDPTRRAGDEAAPAPDDESALYALLETLDGHRERVEDDSASALFDEAAGFGAHRVEGQLLLESLDLRFVSARLGWDAARTALWLERSRANYRRTLVEALPERIAARLELEARGEGAPERVLQSWAAVFASPAARRRDDDWRRWSQLAVFDELSTLFDGPSRAGLGGVALPFQDPDLLLDEPGGAANWVCVARAELGPSAGAEELLAAARQWSEAFEGRFDRELVRSRTAAVLARWEQEFQRALRDELTRAGVVTSALRRERLERAGERARFVLKDHGNRARVVLRRPSYATTYLLTLHRDRFAGFVVQDAHERVGRLGADGQPIAAALVGGVGAPTIQEELLARELRGKFDSLSRKGVRADSEDAELLWLAQALSRPDELRGRGGVEAYFDRELSGRNGYREARGLQDVVDGRFELDVAPIDGLDLTLTLDLELQQAASATMAAPAGDPNPAFCDYAWLGRPTGALVFLRVDGSVLAAASHPEQPRTDRGAPGVADAAFERTLRKPGFQPPGSSFKPFVAAWALDRLRSVDPTRTLDCAMLPDGSGAGYVDVRCNVRFGHGAVDLRDALKRSCNSYFAMLGERLSMEEWRALAEQFGFGAPTGVRSLGARAGLVEDTFPALFERELDPRAKRLAGNGLAVVEATPMQLARATAALATGALPQIRLVQRVGDVELASEPRPLALSRASLEFVREAMVACANEPGGSAREALNEGELGWRFAAKTGSGDIGVERVETADGQSRVRKHTWLIGYFPAHAPRYVLVVFCHDTLQTASHSSVWVARQFLQRDEVRAFVAQDGGAR